MAENTPTIKINDKDYNVADLSNEAKAFISQIQFLDSKIAPMKAELAAFQTARDLYSANLNKQLDIKAE